MPQLSPEVIHLQAGRAYLLDIEGEPKDASSVLDKNALLSQIGHHFVINAEVISRGRSRLYDDLEALRDALSPDLAEIALGVASLGITDREIEIAIRDTLFNSRGVSPQSFIPTFKGLAKTYIDEMKSYPPFYENNRAA